MMARPTKLDTLDDFRIWVTDHDSRIDVWWSNQHELNAKNEERYDKMLKRIASLEHRMVFYAGCAAGAGGLLGSIIPYLIGR